MAQQRQGRRQSYRIYLVTLSIALITLACGCAEAPAVSTPAYTPPPEQRNVINLPEPKYESPVSLEESLFRRRSVRSYTGEPLALQEVSQLLWAAQGITEPGGYRTAPSAGALYPLEVYVAAGDVKGLAPGIYRYEPDGHQLVKITGGDKRAELAGAALGQSSVKEGAAVFIFTGVYERTTGKYGDRGIRYVHIEAGHAAQNLCLQATAIGLGAVTVGAFYDEQVAGILDLPGTEQPLYIIPVGRQQR